MSSSRRLVKIRTRAGDTLSLLGDRFGITAEEIASSNGLAPGAQLQAGRELLIPLPSPEMLAKASAEKLAEHNSGNSPGADAASSVETDGGWENVQGVLFRKGTSARAIEQLRTSTEESNGNTDEAKVATQAKIVEVSEAERSNAAEPVWIYMVGGARVEADSVNETAEGVWYTRGNLSVFIERSRIERIEREREKSIAADSNGSWKERGWSTGNAGFDALIRENGARYGVDPYLIFCVMEQESQFKPRIVSPKGARGLMQLMPGTAARFGVRRPFEPAENIMGGTRYLKQLLENFGGRVDLVLAGYNAGEGAVMKYGGNVPPYRETRNYVQRISKRYGQSRSFVPPQTATNLASGMK
jgi:LysM repeat protein/Zn-finger nucleic acid-binding protein